MKVNLDEHQTNLVREHMHLGILIEELKRQLGTKNPLQKKLVQATGTTFTNKQKLIKEELRKMNLFTWHEEQGDMVYITVSHRGVKERFGLKRKIVDEDIQVMLEEFAKWIENNQPPYEPYKIETFKYPYFFAN